MQVCLFAEGLYVFLGRRCHTRHILCKEGGGLQICIVRSEVVLDVLQVIRVFQFWHSCM